MSLGDTINRVLFNLTYNEKAEKAYDDKRKNSETEIQKLQGVINNYRKQRDLMVSDGKASDYVSFNAARLCTEWENWLQKNANLPEGDYVVKKTEMKTTWDILMNINTIAIEMSRISSFLDFFIKDKGEKITIEQKKEIEKLGEDANKYYLSMNSKSPADIVAMRDEYNTRFGKILKSLDPNVMMAKDPKSLLQGINGAFYENYLGDVKKKEKVEQNTFSLKRGANTTKEYTSYFIYKSFQFVFALVFAVIIVNDVIGRPAVIRAYFFFFSFILLYLYPFSYIIAFFYYLYRFFNGSSPVIFSILPLFPKEFDQDKKPSFFSFNYDAHKKDDYAMTQEYEYFSTLAAKVGQALSQENFKKIAADTK